MDISDLLTAYPDKKIDEIVRITIEQDIQIVKPNVLVIDNITFLKTASTQEGDVAAAIMRMLNIWKRQYNLTIIVLAHTPKKNPSEPLNRNHLAGSSNLSNFADNVIAIGQSCIDKNFRYLKQIKPSRSGEIELTEKHVLVMCLANQGKFTGFEFVEYSQEKDHLSNVPNNTDICQNDSIENVRQAFEMIRDGKTYRYIASMLKINPATITKWKTKFPGIYEEVTSGIQFVQRE